MKALEQTADWFRRALAVEPVKGNLRLSGYSACGQDGGVQLPRQYVEGNFPTPFAWQFLVHWSPLARANQLLSNHTEGIADTDLVLLVTTRPTTGNTLAWAVACERDQWGRAIAGIFSSSPVDYNLLKSLHFCEIELKLKPIVIVFFRACQCCSPPFDCGIWDFAFSNSDSWGHACPWLWSACLCSF